MLLFLCLLPVSLQNVSSVRMRISPRLALRMARGKPGTPHPTVPRKWLLTSPSMLLIRTSSLRISRAPWIRSSRFIPFSLAKVSSNPFSASSNVCYREMQNTFIIQHPELESSSPIYVGVLRLPCLLRASCQYHRQY